MVQRISEIIIFGCGGIGSRMAELIVRNDLCEVLRLVDFDVVERKNVERQFFDRQYVGSFKTDALLYGVRYLKKEGSDMEIVVHNRKVTEDADVMAFNKDSFALVCTDNIDSKRVIAEHFSRILIAHCDRNYIEISTFLSTSDKTAWDLGGGYSNEQDIVSNLISAAVMYRMIGTTNGQRRRRFIMKCDDYIAHNMTSANHLG